MSETAIPDDVFHDEGETSCEWCNEPFTIDNQPHRVTRTGWRSYSGSYDDDSVREWTWDEDGVWHKGCIDKANERQKDPDYR